MGIAFVTVGMLGIISLIGLNTGPAGLLAAKVLKYSFGIGSFVIPVLVVIIGWRYIWIRRGITYSIKFWGLCLFYLVSLAIFQHFKFASGQEIMPENLMPGGGLAGGMLLFILRKFLGFYGAFVVLAGLLICAFLMATSWSLSAGLMAAKERAADGFTNARDALACTLEKVHEERREDSRSVSIYNQEREEQKSFTVKKIKKTADILPADEPGTGEAAGADAGETVSFPPMASYVIPSLSLLKKQTKVRSTKMNKEVIENAALLEETLKNFNVSARVTNTCQGPTVTRYELEPAPGVKVSRIVNLADDLALKLAASGVRIEAPIPGKAAIGIEVPNKEVASVPLREVLESDEFQKAASRLTVALGKDIAGQTIIADLAKMPHLLVAGSTGSGKSVCVNTLITSILFKAHPEEVKFILVDPKMVELSNYNGIPHLLVPVVTDSQKAASALRWAVQEMERRYALFAASGVRDIARYNEVTEESQLPLILIIIDELADLMMVAPVDVEDAICRLAQKARAAGIHLVLATQRPSVDVITGIIKANIPSRISFAVSSQIDSRTILDMAGAEKLLGKGDMLFYPVGAAKPVRVQGAFITDGEVEELITFIKKQAEPQYAEGVTNCVEAASPAKQEDQYTDELLEEAVRMVLETGQASTSMLQRKFRIGYTRAARLIDSMEEMKIVGPNIGSKAREIIMTSDQVYSRYFQK
nr:DNA translocase FtsK [Lucifera butyrica]